MRGEKRDSGDKRGEGVSGEKLEKGEENSSKNREKSKL